MQGIGRHETGIAGITENPPSTCISLLNYIDQLHQQDRKTRSKKH